VLEVVSPLSFVHCSVHVVVDSVAICLVVDPGTVVNVSVNMDELSFSVGAIVFPLPFVLRTVRPALVSESIPESPDPLSIIGSSCFESVDGPLFSFGIWVVLPGL